MAVVARSGHPKRASRSILELLGQDWVVNYPDISQDSFMTELFWQHDAQIPVKQLHAQSVQLLLSLIEQTDMLGYCQGPYCKFLFLASGSIVWT